MPNRTSPKPVAAPTQWLTVSEAAAYARVSESLIYKAASAADPLLSGVKLNPENKKSPWRFRASDIDAWLERGRMAS